MWSPTLTSIVEWPSKQWAAVRTAFGDIRVPPHTGPRPPGGISPTCHGQIPAFVPPTMRPCMRSMCPVPHPPVLGNGGNGGPGCGIGGGVTTLHCLTKHVYLRFAHKRFSRILGFVGITGLRTLGLGMGGLQLSLTLLLFYLFRSSKTLINSIEAGSLYILKLNMPCIQLVWVHGWSDTGGLSRGSRIICQFWGRLTYHFLESPGQLTPFLHVRVRKFFPRPQLFEQGVTSLQLLHWPTRGGHGLTLQARSWFELPEQRRFPPIVRGNRPMIIWCFFSPENGRYPVIT